MSGIDEALATTALAWAGLTAANMKAFLVTSASTPHAPTAAFYNRLVYIGGVADKTPTPPTVVNIGAVWGRLGQGVGGLPADAAPLRWLATAAADRAAMLVSFFPDADADTGLATTKKISMQAVGKKWGSFSMFSKPSQPAAASPAEIPEGLGAAAALASSALAATLVVASALY